MAELQVRTHLLVEAGVAGARADRTSLAAVLPALRGRRTAVMGALAEAGDLPGRDRLVAALADEDELLVDEARRDDVLERLQVRARLPAVERELARALAEVSAGRLPVDVASPLVHAHLGAMLAVVGAAREGKGVAAAVDGAIVTARRLLAPLVLAVSAELGLDGDPRGDAAVLRSELSSVLGHDGFARASVALGSSAAPAQGRTAPARLQVVVRRLYGTEVAAHVAASWTAARGAELRLLQALGERDAAGRWGRAHGRATREVTAAREAVDATSSAAASVLAGTVGDASVAPAVLAALAEHRDVLEELRAERGAPGAPPWAQASAGVTRLTDLAAVLASAVARQKSLG